MLWVLFTVLLACVHTILRMAPGHVPGADDFAGCSPLSVKRLPASIAACERRPHRRIPHRIVQSNATNWCTVRMRHNALQWHALNSHYTYDFYDNSRIVAEADLHCLRRITKLQRLQAPGAALADVFRMYALAKAGGIWADIDTCPLTPIDNWVSQHDDCVLYIEGCGTLVHWLIAASPGHPLICAMRDRVYANIDRLEAWPEGEVGDTIFQICGPALFDRVARKQLNVGSGPWKAGKWPICGLRRSVTLRHAHLLPGLLPSMFGMGLGLWHLPAVVKYAGFESDQRSAQLAYRAAEMSRSTGVVTLPSQFN